MRDLPHWFHKTPLTIAEKRRRRIERELRALYAMRSHLTMWEIMCAILTIPVLALLCFIVGFKLHLLSGSPWIGVLAALTCGALIWLIGRAWFFLAVLIVIGLCIIAFEDVPDPTGLDFSDSSNSKSKSGRREKLDHAIARREHLLGQDAPKTTPTP